VKAVSERGSMARGSGGIFNRKVEEVEEIEEIESKRRFAVEEVYPGLRTGKYKKDALPPATGR
jgi:hypothetical protein